MARFLKDTDYAVLIRTEIKSILLENYSEAKLFTAEEMAISQIKNYLAGRYQINLIFQALPENATIDTRNHFIIMTTIDCTLYHLYSSLAPNKIPKHRSERYSDALEWLKMMAKAESTADLPLIVDETTGEVKEAFRLSSDYKASNNKW